MYRSDCARMLHLTPTVLFLTLVNAPPLAAQPQPTATSAPTPIRVLMVVGGAHHDYDAEPKQLAENLSKTGDMKVRVTANLADLNAASLAECDVLMFNACIDKGLDEAQRQAVIDHLRQGKGLVALHCALWCFQDWPEFRKICGGIVLKHGQYEPSPNAVVWSTHPICAGIPREFSILSEPYYADERAPDISVLVQTARVYPDRQGVEPQVWTTRYAGGRVFAMTYGHDAKSQTDPVFLKLLGNGLRWSAGRLGPPTMPSELEILDGFFPLCDGHTLSEFHYDPKLWTIKDGVIIGCSRPEGLKANSFATMTRSFGDFIMRFSVKLVSGNSGVQFRSQQLPGFEVAGYQADVVDKGWGNLHEQNGRGRLVDGWTGKAEKCVNLKDWNEMEIEARGPRIILRANGVVTADYTESDPKVPREGVIALQLHRGEPMEVHFANLRVKPLSLYVKESK